MNRSIIVSAALLLVLGAACKKSSTSGGTTGTIPAGIDIKGTVNTYDDKGNALSDKSGVKVTIHCRGNDSTFIQTTDATGAYLFQTKSFGLYDVTYEKTGMGTYKYGATNYYNSGAPTAPNTLPTVQFGSLSTTQITATTYIDATYNGAPGMSYTLTVSPDPNTNSRAYFRCFLSTDSTVSNSNYTGYTSTVRSIISNNATAGFTRDELVTNFGFTTGQKVWLKVYGESLQTNEYFDEKLGRKIFPNLNEVTPAAISFIVP